MKTSVQPMPPKEHLAGGIIPALAIAAITFAIYARVLHGDFVWDDDAHITQNAALRSVMGLRDIWFSPGSTCQYYPLTFSVFWVVYQIFELNPAGYHTLTTLLHSAAAILLWQFLKRLRVPGAWLAAILFAVHPVNVMSVAWMTELKNTLSASLGLGAALAYIRFAQIDIDNSVRSTTPAKRQWKFYALALILFQLGLFAKTGISFLPLTLLLVVWWKRPSLTRADVMPLVPMLLMALAMGAATILFERNLGGGVTTRDLHVGFVERILISGRSFWFYLGKLIVPYPLTFIYPRWNVSLSAWWQYVFPVATVGFLSALWLARGRIGKGPFTAFFHFYISTSMLVLVQVLYMMRYTFVSDHWVYFGSTSIFALGAAALTAAFDRLQFVSAARASVAAAIIVVFSVMSWVRTGAYAGPETLWRDTLKKNPGCWMAHNNWGRLLEERADPASAENHYRAAIRISPGEMEAHNNLGNLLANRGQLDDALASYREALRLKPDDPSVLNNIGSVLFEKGDRNGAINHFKSALRIDPHYAEAQHNLGTALLVTDDLDAAAAHLRRAVEIQPDYVEAIEKLAVIEARKGNSTETIQHLRTALNIQPSNVAIRMKLGLIFQEQSDWAAAADEFDRCVRLNPSDSQLRFLLGRALARLGRRETAIDELNRALMLNPAHPEAAAELRALH